MSSEWEHDEDVEQLDSSDLSLLKKLLCTKLVETESYAVVMRKRPNSPLYSVRSFEELRLPDNLLRGLYQLGFVAPSRIQELTLPTMLAEPPQNLVAQSQNGTGKTAAFLVACLGRVKLDDPHAQVIILSPTYELAVQTYTVARLMAASCPEITLRLAARKESRRRVTEHILVGTPGTLLDWVLRFRILDLSRLAVFVLDEADVMIDIAGHHDQCIRLHRLLPPSCQILLFSATYTERVMRYMEVIVPDPVVFRLRREDESLPNIRQYYINVKATAESKLNALANIYGSLTLGQTIVFCQRRSTASWLMSQLERLGNPAGLLSGELTIPQRLEVLNRFRKGLERVLITTNVCARGIDVVQVTLVVNFDLPVHANGTANCEAYLHRIGRTGRFGKGGLAVNLVDGDEARRVLGQIERHFGHQVLRLDVEDCDQLSTLSPD